MAHLYLRKVAIASCTGILFVLLGIALGWYGFPLILNDNIIKHITLFPGSEAMERWMNIPFPLEFKVYFFNVTNPDNVSMGEPPKLQEIGPYVFDLYKSKVNITYNKLNDTFTYFNKNKYYFNAEKSHPNKESDKIVLINVPLMGTAIMVEKLFPLGLSFVNTAIPYLFPNISNMFMTATAKEFMYEGVLINCSYKVGPAMPICNGMRGRLPATVRPLPESRDFKFSFFKHKNDSLEGPLTIYGGNRDITKIGQILGYKSSNNLTIWEPNTACSRLRGSDSTLFPPVSNVNEEVFIFISDMCLSLGAIYTNKSIIKDITIYRYEGSERNFADHIAAPENICRCSKNEIENGPPICLKRGVIDASNCQGAPVIFSQPHFLDADPEYRNYPEGLNPIRDKHITYVLIEPNTGAPVIGKKRMQMNIFLRRVQDISLLTNISEGLLPIAWVEEGGVINEEYMKKLSHLYYIIHSLDVAKWTIIGLGFILILVSLILYAKYRMLFCFNRNRVSQFGYTVNSLHVGKPDNSKRSVFNGGNDVQTISNKLYTESKINDSNTDIELPS